MEEGDSNTSTRVVGPGDPVNKYIGGVKGTITLPVPKKVRRIMPAVRDPKRRGRLQRKFLKEKLRTYISAHGSSKIQLVKFIEYLGTSPSGGTWINIRERMKQIGGVVVTKHPYTFRVPKELSLPKADRFINKTRAVPTKESQLGREVTEIPNAMNVRVTTRSVALLNFLKDRKKGSNWEVYWKHFGYKSAGSCKSTIRTQIKEKKIKGKVYIRKTQIYFQKE